MISPIMGIQENNIVSPTKAMVETHISEKSIIIIPNSNEEDYNKSPLHNRNNVKYNCDIAELPEGRLTLTI